LPAAKVAGLARLASRTRNPSPAARSPQPVTRNPQPATRLRTTPTFTSEKALEAIMDPRRLVRWIYIGRMVVATAIFVAIVARWTTVDQQSTLLASLAFALATVVTATSIWYSAVHPGPLSRTFLYLQFISDLLIVTVYVHLTGPAGAGVGPTSFSALYIPVIAMAALLLPEWSSLLVAALGIVLFFTDIWLFQDDLLRDQFFYVQMALFAVVAVSTAALSERLRRGREGTAQLAAHLEQVRLRAEDILGNIHSGVITIDRAGRLVYANPMAERLLDFSMAAFANREVLSYIRAEAPALSEALERSITERLRTNRAEGTVSVNGREFPIGVTTTYMEDPDGNLSATAIFQDISDSKRMELLRIRAERLEGIAELSASLAHEIKNPLASIRSSVEQLGRMPHPGEDERTLASLVMRESDRLSRLLTEFIDFARVRVPRRDSVDVAELVRGAAQLAAAHPDKKDGVKVDCVIPSGEAIILTGDEDMLHRAVFNLALNAVQASPANSTVTIEVNDKPREGVARDHRFKPGAIEIRVSDHGPGVPEEIRSRLFTPFTTTKPQGSGLGLAVVQRAVEAHKGLVLLDSDHQGTRVTMLLPRSAAKVPAFA
jgi:two-component system sensor histidine kinase PilS (NtrC family)